MMCVSCVCREKEREREKNGPPSARESTVRKVSETASRPGTQWTPARADARGLGRQAKREKERERENKNSAHPLPPDPLYRGCRKPLRGPGFSGRPRAQTRAGWGAKPKKDKREQHLWIYSLKCFSWILGPPLAQKLQFFISLICLPFKKLSIPVNAH